VKRAGLAAALALSGLAAPALAGSPGFDCRKAVRADERAICRSPALAASDRRMTRDYRAILSCLGMGSRDAERDVQSAWLARRAACGANTACIKRLYRSRLAQLAPRAARARTLASRQMCPGPV
jgi:uncharacterized protein